MRISVAQSTMAAGPVLVLLAAALLAPVATAGTLNSRRLDLDLDLLPQDCGRRLVTLRETSRGFIVGTGNTTAFYGQFPWQARIEVYAKELGAYVHKCGGIIITKWHVLTAAHCVSAVSHDHTYVRVGDLEHGRSDGSSEREYGVAAIYIHDKYSQGTNYANDIALLTLKADRSGQGIKFDKYVQPACLPDSNTIYQTDSVCEVSGWGKSSDFEPISAKLRYASVPLVSDQYCSANDTHGSRFVPGQMFCAGFVRGGPDSCGGDSGGPLVCRDSTDTTNDRFVAFGIVSNGDPLGCGKLPGVLHQGVHLCLLDTVVASCASRR